MNVLFVCTGNTCRSPMAEYYLKSLKLSDVSVLSAGIYAGKEPISKNSADALCEIGINAQTHISRPLNSDMVESADKIYCMTATHKATLLAAGVDPDKLFLLGNGISDPFGGDISVYRDCRDQIITAIDGIFKKSDLSVDYLTEADAESINEIEKVCFSSPWSVESIKSSMASSNIFLGVKEDDKLIGYLSFYESFKECYINNVAVLPEFRRRGVARALLSELMNIGQNADFDFITLEVRESNSAAISLYTSFGFKEEGKRKKFYTSPSEDAIILTRRF